MSDPHEVPKLQTTGPGNGARMLAANIGLTASYGFYAASAVASYVFVKRAVVETCGRELETMTD